MFFFGRRRTPAGESGAEELIEDLRALSAASFPKRCQGCGRVFMSLDNYLHETFRPGAARAGARLDEDGRVVLDLYRRCVCGAALVDCFTDRRDYTDAGVERREQFGKVVDTLVARGVEREVARDQLLAVMRGQPSDVLRVAPAY